MYVSLEEYEVLSNDKAVGPEKLESVLRDAERHIDSLTFNRIKGLGFDRLTDFQRELVKQSVVDQADFKHQYGIYLENPLSSYAINGVSMTWDTSKVLQVRGVYTTASIYGVLRQTGLTYRGCNR